jgi:hypothetical protein
VANGIDQDRGQERVAGLDGGRPQLLQDT